MPRKRWPHDFYCESCETFKEPRDFYRNPRGRSGYMDVCKECHKARVKRNENREPVVEMVPRRKAGRIEYRRGAPILNDEGLVTGYEKGEPYMVPRVRYGRKGAEARKRRKLQEIADKKLTGEQAPTYRGKHTSTGYMGVVHKPYYNAEWDSTDDFYYAHITVKGHHYYIGNGQGGKNFLSPEAAARAYDEEVERLGLNRTLNSDLYDWI